MIPGARAANAFQTRFLHRRYPSLPQGEMERAAFFGRCSSLSSCAKSVSRKKDFSARSIRVEQQFLVLHVVRGRRSRIVELPMRGLLLLCASILAFMLFVVDEASAQRRSGGRGFVVQRGVTGFRPPVVRPRAIRPGAFSPAVRARAIRAGAVRPGFRRVGVRRVAPGRVVRARGWPVYRQSRFIPANRWYYGRRWVGPRYYPSRYWGWRRWDDGWGWGAAGLAVGTVISAAAASTYPVYAQPVASSTGGYCATPVRTCALIDRAPVGIGCSCRVPGGRARGTVIGP